jgi:cell filamentation protein
MITIGRSSQGEAEYDRFHYEGTNVLINKKNIIDQTVLEKVERSLSLTRFKEGFPSSINPHTYDGFKKVHHHLFQDVYSWAGQERTYTTGRGPAPFATPENIGPWVEKQFQSLKDQNFLRGLNAADFARKAAVLVNEINAAHPFIDGNGRAQRAWLRLVGAEAGHKIEFRSADRKAWYEASRLGFVAVDHAPMAKLIEQSIVRSAITLPRRPAPARGRGGQDLGW